MNELAWVDAVGQAERVRRGDVSPLELVDDALARIERTDPKAHAISAPLVDQARRVAASPDLPAGPFRGVPLLVKDVAVLR
jgi:amidase